MKESRGPIVEFLSSQKKKLFALAAGASIVGGAIRHETEPVAAETTVEVAKKPMTAHEAMMDALKRSDTDRTIETSAQIDERFAAIDKLINLAYFKDNSKEMIIQVDRYLGVLLSPPLTKADAEYAGMTLEEVGDCLRETIEHGKKKEADEARRIVKGRVREGLIDATLYMSPEEIVGRGVLLGLDMQRSHSTSSAELGETWENKMERKSSTSDEVKKYGPSTVRQLEGMEESVTLSRWIDKQQAAIDLFAAHAKELGYSPELIKLITPESILGVIHAETCSDLKADVFVRLSPVLFETYNIAFLPAGDKNYSGGLVQITADTVKRILAKHRETLERIRSTDSGAKFIVASEGDTEEMAASITDEETQYFLNVFVLAENLRLGMRTVNKDPRFVSAWNAASESDRALYVCALMSMANNLPSAAKHAAEAALDENPHSLAEMTKRLSEHTTVKSAARNGRVGGETMEFLVGMAEKKDSWE